MWEASKPDGITRARRILYGADGCQVKGLHSDPRTPQKDQRRETCLFSDIISSAGLPASELPKILKRASAISFVIFLTTLLSGKAALSVFAALPPLIEYALINKRIYKRAVSFERDYPAFLLSLASAVRTGLDPIVALYRAPELFDDDSELKHELLKTKDNIERGMPEDEALRSFAVTIKHPDINLFRTAFILSRQQGSSLSQCLQRLVRVTRQRQSFRRKMASAIAMQKLSAMGIAACALAIGLFQFITNPTAFSQAMAHPVGFKFFVAGSILMASGILWMLNIARRRL